MNVNYISVVRVYSEWSDAIIEIFVGLANAVIVAIVSWLVAKFKAREAKHEAESLRRDKEYDALKNGLRSLLKDRIVQSCNFISQVGGITITQLQNIEGLESSYELLGGNGAVKALYGITTSLPIITDDEFHIRKAKLK